MSNTTAAQGLPMCGMRWHLDPAQPCLHNTTPCPTHHAEISFYALRSYWQDQRVLGALVHADHHGWARSMVNTWAALYFGHVVPNTPEHARAKMTDPQFWKETVRAHNVREGEQWLELLRMFMLACFYQDGDQVIAVLDTVRGSDTKNRFQFTWSLLRSLESGLERTTRDGHTDRLVTNLYHLYGLELNHTARLPVVPPLVDLTAASVRGQALQRPDLTYRLVDLPPALLLHSVSVAASGLAMFIPPDGDFDIVGRQDLDQLYVAWQDESLDPLRNDEVLASCHALRLATAFARRDTEQAHSIVDGVPVEKLSDFVVKTLLASVLFVAAQVKGPLNAPVGHG